MCVLAKKMMLGAVVTARFVSKAQLNTLLLYGIFLFALLAKKIVLVAVGMERSTSGEQPNLSPKRNPRCGEVGATHKCAATKRQS